MKIVRRALGCEEAVRDLQGAGSHLLDPTRAGQCRGRQRAEDERSERGGVEHEVRGGVGPGAPGTVRSAFEPEPSGRRAVRAHRVLHLEHERVGRCVAARAEQRGDVDRAEPQPVVQLHRAHLPAVAQPPRELDVLGHPTMVGPAGEVDVAEVLPERGLGVRRGRDQVLDRHRPRVEVGTGLVRDAVDRVALDAPVDLVHDVEAVLDRVLRHPWAGPPDRRSGDRAVARGVHPREELGRDLDALVRLDQPQPSPGDRFGEDNRVSIQLDRQHARRDAVPEPPVDRALGRGQDRRRVPAARAVLEQERHHRSEDPPPPVRRPDRDPAHRGGGHDRAAGQREVERVVASGADDLVPVEDRDRPVELRLGPARVQLALVLADTEPVVVVALERGELVHRDRPRHEIHGRSL